MLGLGYSRVRGGGGSGAIVTSTYSIQVTTCGTGKSSKVLVSKTKNLYNRQVQAKEPYRQELQAVKAMLT